MVKHYLTDQFERYERLLALGAYQDLLPRTLRRRAVIAQFDVDRFVAAVDNLRLTVASESIADPLTQLAQAGAD
jgi:hypothetical protein